MGGLISSKRQAVTQVASQSKVGRYATSLLRTTSRDPDQKSREQTLNVLLLGTLALIFGALIVVAYNLVVLQLTHLMPRVVIIAVVAIGMIGLYDLFKRGNYKLPTYSLLSLYFASAVAVFYQWGTNNPMGLLLSAFVIILAGILLGARYAMYALFIVVGLLSVLTSLALAGVIVPDMSWAGNVAGLYDVIAFGIILANVAVVSWLFNRSMEQSLARAHRSEKALRHQKEILEVKVEKRTRELQAAHLERIQELYRFAELGHMSVALLHDMANYLAVLSLDMEDLKQERENRSVVVRRVQQSIRHLNSLIGQVRQQIKGETTISQFNAADEIAHVMKILEYKARAAEVELVWEQPPAREAMVMNGSVSHFWQVMMNIISNGIDAYGSKQGKERSVRISAAKTKKGIEVRITDLGKGIPSAIQGKIFEPFYSTKKGGTGIGLAIAKRMVEKDLGGSIHVDSNPGKGTTFTVVFSNATNTDA